MFFIRLAETTVPAKALQITSKAVVPCTYDHLSTVAIIEIGDNLWLNENVIMGPNIGSC